MGTTSAGRAELFAAVAPHIKALHHELVDALMPQIDKLLERVRADAITRIDAAFAIAPEVVDGEAGPAADDPSPEPSPRRRKEGTSRASVAAPAGSGRRCRSCRELGHRANHCPNATTVQIETKPPKSERAPAIVNKPPPVVNGEPPPLSKSDRFARIEAAARRRGADE